MIIITACCSVRQGKAHEFIKLAQELIKESRQENGCLFYGLFTNPQKENELTFIEHWADQRAIEQHNASAHFKKFVPLLGQLQQTEAQVTLYTEATCVEQAN